MQEVRQVESEVVEVSRLTQIFAENIVSQVYFYLFELYLHLFKVFFISSWIQSKLFTNQRSRLIVI